MDGGEQRPSQDKNLESKLRPERRNRKEAGTVKGEGYKDQEYRTISAVEAGEFAKREDYVERKEKELAKLKAGIKDPDSEKFNWIKHQHEEEKERREKLRKKIVQENEK